MEARLVKDLIQRIWDKVQKMTTFIYLTLICPVAIWCSEMKKWCNFYMVRHLVLQASNVHFNQV